MHLGFPISWELVQLIAVARLKTSRLLGTAGDGKVECLELKVYAVA